MQTENHDKRTPAQQKKIDRMLSQKKIIKKRDIRRRKERDSKYEMQMEDTATPRIYGDKHLKAAQIVQMRWRYNRFQECMEEVDRLLKQYDVKGRYWIPGVPAIMRCSKYSGGDQWRCYHYQSWLISLGLCKHTIVQELVYGYLLALGHNPIISPWRKTYIDSIKMPHEITQEYNKQKHNLVHVNLTKAQCITRRRRAAISIQTAFRKKRKRDHHENILNGDDYRIRLNLNGDTTLGAKPGTEWYQIPQEGVSYTYLRVDEEKTCFYTRKYIVFERSAPFDCDLFKECKWQLSWDLGHIKCPVRVCGRDITIYINIPEFSLFNNDEDMFYERNPNLYYRDRPKDSLSDTNSVPSLYGCYTAEEEISAEVIQKKWRLYQIRRMRPFYLVPLPSTDSMPYLVRPKMAYQWKQKPSFRMVYVLVNGRVITTDCSIKGGPSRVTDMNWTTMDMAKLYWNTTPETVRRWDYGKDYTVRITRDMKKFHYKPLAC
jgi:hypothetical protein